MSDPVSFAPLVQYAAPIVVAIAAGLIAKMIAPAAAEFTKLTKIQIKQSAIDDISARAQTAVGGAIAAAADNLAGRQITIGNPIVASIVKDVVNDAPEMLDHAGFDATDVAKIVLGHIGTAQASMTTVPAAPAAKAI